MDTVRKFQFDAAGNANDKVCLTFKDNKVYYFRLSGGYTHNGIYIHQTAGPETQLNLDVRNIPTIIIDEVLPLIMNGAEAPYETNPHGVCNKLVEYVLGKLSPYIHELEKNVDRLLDTLSERIQTNMEKTEIISTMYDHTETLQREMVEMRAQIQRDASLVGWDNL
jgi:hypothetical protein